MVITSAGVFDHYRTASGQEVAVVGPGDGGNTVTCNGTTTTVAGMAACEMLTEGNCTSGSCPP